jgi:hypothetical protein
MAACGDSAPSKLDVAQVQEMIAKELRNSDIDDAEVKCPDEVELRKDDTFTCDVTPDDSDDFEVEVTQRDADGTVAFDIGVVLLERDDVEKEVATGISTQIDETMTADCSDDFEDDEQILEDGDELSCDLVGENGTTAEAQVTVDAHNEEGFTFTLSGDPVATTTTTTTTTLPPTTLPPEDPIDTTDTTAIEGTTVFFDGFFDNSSGWFVVEDTPGLSVEVTGENYTWFVQPEAETDPLPFEAVADEMQELNDLTDVDVSVQLSFLQGGMGGVSCMSTTEGSYVFAVGSNSVYIAKLDEVRELVPLVTEPFSVDASETFVEVRVECFPNVDGMQLNLEVDGEQVASVTDNTDPHLSGTAGVFLDFDREIPQEERVEAVVVFDDFEVLEF